MIPVPVVNKLRRFHCHENHVGTAALGCPAEQRSAALFAYFFGGTVNPKTEICPDPATFKPPDSSGFGK